MQTEGRVKRFRESVEHTPLLMARCVCRKRPQLRRVDTVSANGPTTSEWYVRCVDDCDGGPGMLYRDSAVRAIREWDDVMSEKNR